ncbi:hypothetical protein Anapl_09706 [Anas platyrhynchos]|uniref:Uncharacterized protein n=1 Tax=Anas platyrhynchos TaxID=8839 RepID=R0L348_ANAPL|nr:hypothetical protein Anapl_09706 [Anas platyrhynchos]
MPFSAAASCGMNNPCSQKTSLRNEQSGSATTAEHFGDAGGRQQQHEQRAPQIGDKIKGAALPALPPMGSKIKPCLHEGFESSFTMRSHESCANCTSASVGRDTHLWSPMLCKSASRPTHNRYRSRVHLKTSPKNAGSHKQEFVHGFYRTARRTPAPADCQMGRLAIRTKTEACLALRFGGKVLAMPCGLVAAVQATAPCFAQGSLGGHAGQQQGLSVISPRGSLRSKLVWGKEEEHPVSAAGLSSSLLASHRQLPRQSKQQSRDNLTAHNSLRHLLPVSRLTQGKPGIDKVLNGKISPKGPQTRSCPWPAPARTGDTHHVASSYRTVGSHRDSRHCYENTAGPAITAGSPEVSVSFSSAPGPLPPTVILLAVQGGGHKQFQMKPVEILNVQSHPNSQTFLMKERQMVETDLTSALAGQAATGCRATPEEGLPQPLQKLLIAQALADTAGRSPSATDVAKFIPGTVSQMSAVNIKTEEERKKDKAIEDATARFLAGMMATKLTVGIIAAPEEVKFATCSELKFNFHTQTELLLPDETPRETLSSMMGRIQQRRMGKYSKIGLDSCQPQKKRAFVFGHLKARHKHVSRYLTPKARAKTTAIPNLSVLHKEQCEKSTPADQEERCFRDRHSPASSDLYPSSNSQLACILANTSALDLDERIKGPSRETQAVG